MNNYALLFNIGLLYLYLVCLIMFMLCIYQTSILLCPLAWILLCPLAWQLSKDVPADVGFLCSKGAMLCSGIKKGILCYRLDYFVIPGSNTCSTIPCDVWSG